MAGGRSGEADIRALLREMSAGSEEALDELIPLVYEELRVIAHHHVALERSSEALDSTALVHELYLRLVEICRLQWRDRSHFFAVASRLMRRILIDHARRRRRSKRGGENVRVPFLEGHAWIDPGLDELLALDEALTRLEAIDQRQCRVVECRYFMGLTVAETAATLGVSPGTVKRDWRQARAWLAGQLSDRPVP
jgi:RNA polymerase sigma factor (TIGR02999 family)